MRVFINIFNYNPNEAAWNIFKSEKESFYMDVVICGIWQLYNWIFFTACCCSLCVQDICDNKSSLVPAYYCSKCIICIDSSSGIQLLHEECGNYIK